MPDFKEIGSCRYLLKTNEPEGLTLFLSGKMDIANAALLIAAFKEAIPPRAAKGLLVDLKEVTYLDDFGILVLWELKQLMVREGKPFFLANARPEINELLKLDLSADTPTGSQKLRTGTLVRLGEGSIRIAGDVRFLVSFIGSVFLALAHTGRHPRSLRLNDTLYYMQKAGVDAVPIVGLISFLLGMIIAFMSAAQLQQFGANIFVATLVSVAMIKELGPIMTAIIVAGRTGSAFAAEIGTMRISNEIDALFIMGFDPTRFLVVPRIIATVITMPLLVLFADLFAICGGLLMGVSMLDLTANAYLSQTIKSVTLFDLLLSYAKSMVFAFLIAWIGSLRGFQVKGGAASVGQATTSAVVSSIFLIISADAVFAVILRYW